MVSVQKDRGPAYVAPQASILGEVVLGEGSSIWPCAVLRGDLAPIRIGRQSNVQDGAILHVARNLPCIVGDEVTIGHGAIAHGCTVGNRCIIGMGAILLNGSSIGEDSIVGAGTLVTEGKNFPPRSLILGSPGRAVRQLTEEELTHIKHSAESYLRLALEASGRDASSLGSWEDEE